MMEISLQQQLNVNPSLRQYEQVLRDFLGKYLSYESLREDMAKLYMDRFSELQLVQMLAFYRTTTGQLAVSELPKLSQAGAELGARRIEEHKAELMQALFETHQPKP
jgi:hypothetical protein